MSVSLKLNDIFMTLLMDAAQEDDAYSLPKPPRRCHSNQALQLLLRPFLFRQWRTTSAWGHWTTKHLTDEKTFIFCGDWAPLRLWWFYFISLLSILTFCITSWYIYGHPWSSTPTRMYSSGHWAEIQIPQGWKPQAYMFLCFLGNKSTLFELCFNWNNDLHRET